MSLRIYNISKGACEEEKVCAERLMRFLYGGRAGGAALWLLVARGIFSRACGLWADSKISRCAVKKFIVENGIDTEEMLKNPDEFKTFNEFFTRALKSGARPVGDSQNPRAVSFPSDGRHLLIRGVSGARSFYAKARSSTLRRFSATRSSQKGLRAATC